jgi:hypothetical protein
MFVVTANFDAQTSSREALRRKGERLRKFTREGLVSDDERELDDLGGCEMFLQLHKTFVRDLAVVADDPLAEFKRRTLPVVEMWAVAIDQKISKLFRWYPYLHANGVADVHSVKHAIKGRHLHVEQRAKLSIDLSEPFDGAVEPA